MEGGELQRAAATVTKKPGLSGISWRLTVLVLPFSLCVQAGPGLNTDSPAGFFTDLGSRLLRSEFNLDLHRLQIYPTNQYTPAVHRLLQVTANIYDAMTNQTYADGVPFPTVFRPQFERTANNQVFITNFVEVINADAVRGLTLRDLTSSNVAAQVQPDDLIFGVPPVVGVRKGLPNFNEFAMETVVQVTRKVELRKRPDFTGGFRDIVETNQTFIIGISNVMGVEFWNSYATNYTRPVEIYVTNYLVMQLTNDFGLVPGDPQVMANGNPLFRIPSAYRETNFWLGWNGTAGAGQSFFVALRTNVVFLNDAAYQQSPSPGQFVLPVPNAVSNANMDFYFPGWGLTVTNRLQAMVVDRDSRRLVDYVQLGGLTGYLDLARELGQSPLWLYFNGLWGTNALGDHLTGRHGVQQQILVSWGLGDAGDNWNDYGIGQPQGQTRLKEIAKFLAFFSDNHIASYGGYLGTNTNQVTTTPFIPSRKLSLPLTWQANDPLVHYMSGDMLYLDQANVPMYWNLRSIPNQATLANLGFRNNRYQPWGFPYPDADVNSMNVALKDSLIKRSDHWQFPTNKIATIGWLGRVHRGTPWQTIFMKSTNVNSAIWQRWTGNPNFFDALRSQPTRDWSLVALLHSLINTNDPRQLVSINESNTNLWLAVLDGVVALTNSTPDGQVPYVPPQFDPVSITSNSPQATILVEAIFSTRTSQPHQRFNDLGAVLAAAELSVASPWLNRSQAQIRYGISDEAYETIPAQLLPRLRPDSVGSISAFGGVLNVQFTGFDDYPYAVETSSNLVNWLPLSTNLPTNGVFELIEPVNTGNKTRFYRSRLQ